MQTHDVCGQRSVELMNHFASCDDQGNRAKPDHTGDNSGQHTSVTDSAEPQELPNARRMCAQNREDVIAWDEETVIEPKPRIDERALNIGAYSVLSHGTLLLTTPTGWRLASCCCSALQGASRASWVDACTLAAEVLPVADEAKLLDSITENQ